MADQGPCVHRGAVLPLSRLVRVDEDGAWAHPCPGCAIAVPAGGGASRRGGR